MDVGNLPQAMYMSECQRALVVWGSAPHGPRPDGRLMVKIALARGDAVRLTELLQHLESMRLSEESDRQCAQFWQVDLVAYRLQIEERVEEMRTACQLAGWGERIPIGLLD